MTNCPICGGVQGPHNSVLPGCQCTYQRKGEGMSYEKTGGPAFPHPAGWRRDPHISDGMTLRDYFAAKAMQSVITQEIAALRRVNEYTAKSSEDVMAEWAYKMADAMLKKREQE